MHPQQQRGLRSGSGRADPGRQARCCQTHRARGDGVGWEREGTCAGRAAHGKGARRVGGGTRTVLLRQRVIPQHKCRALPSGSPIRRSPCSGPGVVVALEGDAIRQKHRRLEGRSPLPGRRRLHRPDPTGSAVDPSEAPCLHSV